MAETAVRLKWTSGDKRFFLVAEVEMLFCIGERLPRVQGQACGSEQCQTVGKMDQHERQHFMTKHGVVALWAEWPLTTSNTNPTAIMKHQQVRMLDFVNFIPHEGLTCFPSMTTLGRTQVWAPQTPSTNFGWAVLPHPIFGPDLAP